MTQNYYPPYTYPQPSPVDQKKLVQSNEKKEILTAGIGLGAVIIAYLFLQSIAVEWLNNSGLRGVYASSSMFQSFFNVLGVHMFSMLIPFGALALIYKKRYVSPVVPTKKVGVKPFWAWVSFGMLTSYIANILVAFVIGLFKQFGYELTKSENLKPSSVLDCLALIVATAIIPAIIEELAMRCFGLGILRRHGKGFAVFAMSVVFGLLHGNVIQFIFAFSLGMILGFITVQTDSVIPAMMIHGLNNGLSVTQTIVKFGAGTRASNIAISSIYFIWIVLGIISFIYLISTKRLFKKENKQKNIYSLNVFTKVLYFLPGMIVPLLILIFISAKTIVKI